VIILKNENVFTSFNTFNELNVTLCIISPSKNMFSLLFGCFARIFNIGKLFASNLFYKQVCKGGLI